MSGHFVHVISQNKDILLYYTEMASVLHNAHRVAGSGSIKLGLSGSRHEPDAKSPQAKGGFSFNR